MTDVSKISLPPSTQQFISKLKKLGFSENQILGQFFLLGAVIATPSSDEEWRRSLASVTALVPFDYNISLNQLIGSRFIDQEQIIEEFLHWLGIDHEFRQIEIEGQPPRQVLTPKSHGLFSGTHTSVKTLADIHHLYMAFFEAIGVRMSANNTSASDALLCGIFQLKIIWSMDNHAAGSINSSLKNLMSPLLFAIRSFAMCGEPSRIDGLLDTQVGLQGLWGGLDDLFMSVAWPFQSWLFFKDGEQLMGVEEASTEEFWSHCCLHAKSLIERGSGTIPKLSNTTVELDELPAWGSPSFNFDNVDAYMHSVWGYNHKTTNHYTDFIHYRACLIHCIYSSVCKAQETMN